MISLTIVGAEGDEILEIHSGTVTANVVHDRCNFKHYTQGDSDVISSHQLFSAILQSKLCEMFVVLTSLSQ